MLCNWSLKAAIWLLLPTLTLGRPVGTGFFPLTGRSLVCDGGALESLMAHDGLQTDYFQCARVCLRLPNCTNFVLEPAAGSGCQWCPAHRILGLNNTFSSSQHGQAADQETWWVLRGGGLDDLPTDTYIAIWGGGLPIGRLLTAQGRISDPPPDRFYFDLFDVNKTDIILRVTPRFVDDELQEVVIVSTLTDGEWSVPVNEEAGFPLEAGGRFDLDIVVTSLGFVVYVNGE